MDIKYKETLFFLEIKICWEKRFIKATAYIPYAGNQRKLYINETSFILHTHSHNTCIHTRGK